MEVTPMESNKGMGLFSIILGLIFIIFPMISEEVVSIIIGLSLLFFGISAIFTGFDMKKYANNTHANLFIVIGIIVAILGFLFIFYIDALSFLVGIQFYLIGFILIIFGIAGLLSRPGTLLSLLTSILVIIMGIFAVALAAFAMAQPIYIAIIIGIILIIEGLMILFID
jgi:uncharacterized membrane protein HdeD (DUF308 family)